MADNKKLVLRLTQPELKELSKCFLDTALQKMDSNTLIEHLNTNYAKGIYFKPKKYTPFPRILHIPEPNNEERGASVHLNKNLRNDTYEMTHLVRYEGRFEGGKEVAITFLLNS